jgi:hypothetical protein
MFADFARTPTAQAHVEFAESQAAAAQTMRQDHRGRAVRIDRLSRSPLGGGKASTQASWMEQRTHPARSRQAQDEDGHTRLL